MLPEVRRPRQPEINLLLAVIETACNDILSHTRRGSQSARRPLVWLNAYRYFFEADRHLHRAWPSGFLSACAVLDWDPDAVRAAIERQFAALFGRSIHDEAQRAE